MDKWPGLTLRRRFIYSKEQIVIIKTELIYKSLVKTILYSLLIINLNITAMASNINQGIETPYYKVIKNLDKIELREYPELITATTIMGKSYSGNSGNGFRKVAGYIFGANDRNEKISMTSPVMVEMADTMRMSFIMPSKYNIDDLPRPDNSGVSIEKQTPGTVAVIRYSGYNNDIKMEKYKNILIEEINKNNLEVCGDFMFLGYNPPYRLINRKNEIMVQVKWDENKF